MSLFHETYEAFTDPFYPTGWIDTSYIEEIADICESAAFYSVELSNGKRYSAMAMWDNNIGCTAGSGAELTYSFSSVTAF